MNISAEELFKAACQEMNEVCEQVRSLQKQIYDLEARVGSYERGVERAFEAFQEEVGR